MKAHGQVDVRCTDKEKGGYNEKNKKIMKELLYSKPFSDYFILQLCDLYYFLSLLSFAFISFYFVFFNFPEHILVVLCYSHKYERIVGTEI